MVRQMIVMLGVISLWLSIVATTCCSGINEAACAVHCGDAISSGCCYRVAATDCYVFSTAHGITANSVSVEFLVVGRAPGLVIYRDSLRDIVIVRVSTAGLRVLPGVLPLASPDWRMTVGERVWSVGFPYGQPRTFSARIIGQFSGVTDWDGERKSLVAIQFRPAPEVGRSGAGLVDVNGRLVGLVRAQIGDRPGEHLAAQDGLAVPVAHLWEAQYNCPDGGCRVPQQGRAGIEWRGPRVQVRVGKEWSAGTGPDPRELPTLPEPEPRELVPIPEARQEPPRLDLAPLEERLDRQTQTFEAGLERIATLLDERLPAAGPPEIVVPPEPPDPGLARAEIVAESRQAATEAAEQQVAGLEERHGRLQTALGGLKELVERLAGDRETLHERIETRIGAIKAELGAEAPTKDVLREYARQLIEEKLAGGSAGLTMGKIAAGALGLSGPLSLAVVGAGWLAGRRLKKRIIRRRLADGSEEVEENPQ